MRVVLITRHSANVVVNYGRVAVGSLVAACIANVSLLWARSRPRTGEGGELRLAERREVPIGQCGRNASMQCRAHNKSRLA